MTDQSNSAKGRTSFDGNIGNDLVHFINRNVTPYATESSGPKFDLVPVTKQKDIMVNAARMHAKQEYDRIMQLVAVLQQQAADIKKRLDITDAVHAAKYDFQLYHGQYYWLVWDTDKNITRLVHNGPNNWTTAAPKNYQYLTRIQWLGDHTWREANDN
jgi:hypothetical protein